MNQSKINKLTKSYASLILCINSTAVLPQITLLKHAASTDTSCITRDNALLHSLEITLKHGEMPLCFSLCMLDHRRRTMVDERKISPRNINHRLNTPCAMLRLLYSKYINIQPIYMTTRRLPAALKHRFIIWNLYNNYRGRFSRYELLENLLICPLVYSEWHGKFCKLICYALTLCEQMWIFTVPGLNAHSLRKIMRVLLQTLCYFYWTSIELLRWEFYCIL